MKIDLRNVEDLYRRLRSGKASRVRFRLDHTQQDVAYGLYAAFKAEVETRGEKFVEDKDTLDHIWEAAGWLTDPDGKFGLMLCGMFGNGKTTLARAIASLVQFISECENGYGERKVMRFYTAKEICRRCKMMESKPDAYREPFLTEMAIIDELGEEPNEVLIYGMPETPIADLLGERYARQRLTIVTTNLDADQLKEKYRGRMYDRFREMFKTIVFENESYRK